MNRQPKRENNDHDFEELYDIFMNYYEDFMRYAYLITMNQQTSEDIVQDAFIHAHENYFRYGNEGVILPRIYDFIRNEAIHYVKVNSLERLKIKVPNRKEANPLTIPEKYIFIKETRSKVIHSINCLKPPYRQVILLKYYCEMTLEEIADLMNCSIDEISDLLKGAKDLMVKKLNLKKYAMHSRDFSHE